MQGGGRQSIQLLSLDRRGHAVVVRRIAVVDGVRSIALSRDGRRLALSTQGGNLRNRLDVVDLRSGSRVSSDSLQGEGAAFYGSVAWSPDGRWLAVARWSDAFGAPIEIRDARSLRRTKTLRVSARLDRGLAWSTDGRSLFYVHQPTLRHPPRLRSVRVHDGRIGAVIARGFDPHVTQSGELAYAAAGGIWVRAKGRSARIVGMRPGDRAPLAAPRRIVFERPVRADCPPGAFPVLCSVVLSIDRASGASTPVVQRLARSPFAAS